MDAYQPSPEILQKYADVLVKFALNDGKGIRKGEVVLIQVPESAKPMYVPLRNTVLKAGAFPIMHFLPDGVHMADVFNLSNEEQLSFFPDKYFRGLVDQCDHSIHIISEADKYELKQVDPKKIFTRSKAFKPYQDWRHAKESAGKFNWTLAMYGTPAMANDVSMSLKEYWDEIIKACYLDQPDPVGMWRQTMLELERIRAELN